MTGALEAAYLNVTNVIPYEILELAFEPVKYRQSMEQRIYDTIIGGRVYREISINCGITASITLTEDMIEYTEQDTGLVYPYQMMYAVYRVPPEKREYRPIVGVVSVAFPFMNYGVFPMGAQAGNPSYSPQSVNSLSQLSQEALIAASGTIQGVTKPIPELMGSDLIKLTPTAGAPMPGFAWILTCRLQYDGEFTNLSGSAIQVFADMILYATMSYIWTLLVVKIDKFYANANIEIGRVKELIDGYAEGEEKYQEKRKLFMYVSSALEAPVKKKLIYSML